MHDDTARDVHRFLIEMRDAGHHDATQRTATHFRKSREWVRLKSREYLQDLQADAALAYEPPPGADLLQAGPGALPPEVHAPEIAALLPTSTATECQALPTPAEMMVQIMSPEPEIAANTAHIALPTAHIWHQFPSAPPRRLPEFECEGLLPWLVNHGWSPLGVAVAAILIWLTFR